MGDQTEINSKLEKKDYLRKMQEGIPMNPIDKERQAGFPNGISEFNQRVPEYRRVEGGPKYYNKGD